MKTELNTKITAFTSPALSENFSHESGNQTVYVEWSSTPVQNRDLVVELEAKLDLLKLTLSKFQFQMAEVRYLLKS